MIAASRAMCAKLVDIGVNLTDSMYQGVYNGTKKHECDVRSVIERALNNGVSHMLVTGTSLSDSIKALDIVKDYPTLYCTVGCHPTQTREFEHDSARYLEQLTSLALDNRSKVKAIGEFGLDYDRLHFSPKDIQRKYFALQMQLADATKLPLFLHCRAAAGDSIETLSRHRDSFTSGVVHSFTGTWAEAESFLQMGLYIGINGCSLKTQENIDVVKKLPLDKIMLETDAPWCEIKSTHAGHQYIKSVLKCNKKEKFIAGEGVKGRNEPINLVQVLQVLAAVRGESEEQIANVTTANALRLFSIPL